ncbi:cadherin-like protein 26 isoform X3 [Lutra lutra]|nr:cadherin-like protein 26 isoform X3 [Lutra lutra]
MLTVDVDEENTPNSQVLYFLISQTPSLKESGFQIDRLSGEMQLSGCLDYETAPRFTLLVGAKDLGEPPLTSTATVHVNVQEGNNHRPTFTRENYRIQVSEGRTSPSVLRLPVRDGDLPFTSAWRVRFHILNGNEEGHFDILTDPETNEGILNVIKPLDYETRPARSLVIAVENEELLFPCEGGRVRGPGGVAASATVSVQVMDANDPPAFHPRSFVVSEVDGAGPGIQLGVFNATDPDRAAGPVRYKLAYDPASWVTVDELSGTVTTTQQMDRESPYVNHSFYTIIVQAVDDGLPPQTGTGTLMLFLSDVNDNAPALHPRSQYMEVCESALSETLLLQAEDADLEPYADPFTFELDNSWESAGDTWKLGESRGRSVELLMLTSLPPGNYSVPLFIRDKQGLSQKQTVHVRVCSCPGGGTCVEPSVVVTGTGLLMGALAPTCAALVMLAATLLCLLRCCFVSEVRPGSSEEGQQTLIMYNDESKPISTQGRPDIMDQVPVLVLDAAGAGAELGTKGCDMLFEPRGVRNKYSTLVFQDTVVPRQCLDARAWKVVETLSQKLRGLDALAGDTGEPPHIYAEEGECEGAESLSSLAFSEPDQDPWASQAAAREEMHSKSGGPS